MASLTEFTENQNITEMLERARIQGFIIADDLFELCGNNDPGDKFTKKVMQTFMSEGVEIVDLGENEEELDSLIVQENIQGYDTAYQNPADTIGLYMKEMSRVPLLTFQDEINLAKQIKAGKEAEMQLMCDESSLTDEDILLLEKICQDGELAWEHLIKANTRLVVSVAKRYSSQSVPLLDLIQKETLV